MEVDNFNSYPLPPPWKKMGDIYVHDITGEESSEHPFQRMKSLRNVLNNSNRSINYEKDDNKIIETDLVLGINEDDKNNTSFLSERENFQLNSFQNTNLESSLSNKNGKTKTKALYFDFRCHWKELNLFGEKQSFGLTIRYYDEDGRTIVKFDGLDGGWHLTTLEGPYGPLDRNDLFLGAKVKIFGRHLTIHSANASICHWIHVKGKKLMKQQNWYRDKIESVGAIAVVKRPPPREVKAEGHTDLRRLINENSKLCEQLSSLGLNHYINAKI